MRKIIFTFLMLTSSLTFMYAGGIVTNTNQSGAWVRSMARSASVDVDAVFYNPAGTTHLEEGLHIQLNSQTISQTRTITNDLASLNSNTYEGKTFVPALPSVFVAYKTGKLAFSGGFLVIGGGGSADYEKGLPSFEDPISRLPTLLNTKLGPIGSAIGADFNVSGYEADIAFNGSSAYYGIQGGVAYQINDMLSVSAGARYVIVNNTYEGHIKDISVVTAAGASRADSWINGTVIPTFDGTIANLNGVKTIPTQAELVINEGYGSYTIGELVGFGVLTNEQAGIFSTALQSQGGDPTSLTMNEIKDYIEGRIPAIDAQIEQLEDGKTQLAGQAGQLGDQAVDAKQTGTGITPFFGVDLSLMDGRLGIGLKYEMATAITITNETTKDDTGLFADGVESPSDIPSMLSVGVRFEATDALDLQAAFIYYDDKSAKYGKTNETGAFVDNGTDVSLPGYQTKPYIASNSFELALGGSYALNETAGVSAGFLMTSTSANDIYQTDLSYTQPTMSFGLGGWYDINDMITLELGLFTTTYTDVEKKTAVTETFDKSIIGGGLGLTFNLAGE